jgi:hypothetical protein
MEPYLYFGSLGQHERQFQIANFIGLALAPAHDRRAGGAPTSIIADFVK